MAKPNLLLLLSNSLFRFTWCANVLLSRILFCQCRFVCVFDITGKSDSFPKWSNVHSQVMPIIATIVSTVHIAHSKCRGVVVSHTSSFPISFKNWSFMFDLLYDLFALCMLLEFYKKINFRNTHHAITAWQSILGDNKLILITLLRNAN